MGLTGYYRKFVANYGSIAISQTQQLKKDSFAWNEAAITAFEQLKKAMASVPVLRPPDFTQTFVIETDASGVGVGAVLMQNRWPLAYFSHALPPLHRAKYVYERELLAIVLAVKKWRAYLLGRRFVVRTDQKSLKFLLELRIIEGDCQKWVTKLLSYDFTIEYKKGTENTAADALSRLPAALELGVLNIVNDMNIRVFVEQVDTDAELKTDREKLQRSEVAPVGYSLHEDLLLYNNRLVVPSSSLIIPLLLQEFHNNPMGGHNGVLKTYEQLAREVNWKWMKALMLTYVLDCTVCQQAKYLTLSPVGLFQPLYIPDVVWMDMSMDFVDGLPKSEGFEVILVVVDRLSKYAYFIALKHPYTASSVATIFIREIVRLHGLPRSIVSDRDNLFTSLFWEELFRHMGTHLKRSTTYHPQTDRQTEVVNRILEGYLRCFAMITPKQWAGWLFWVEYSYNTSYHTTTHLTPFEVVYGRAPPALLPYTRDSSKVADVDTQLMARDNMLTVLKQNFLKAQQRMKQFADRKHRRLFLSQVTTISSINVGLLQTSKTCPSFHRPISYYREGWSRGLQADITFDSTRSPRVSCITIAQGNWCYFSLIPSSTTTPCGHQAPSPTQRDLRCAPYYHR